MKIIACLGNPGKKYNKNRHNVGSIIGRYFAEEFNIIISRERFQSSSGSGKIADIDILMLFPLTFMNKSGFAVKEALDFYRESPENLVVVHDEIELPFGDVRAKFGGGHKGHNGIRSIIQCIKTPDFHRIRFGVGRPPKPEIPVADYLLSDFRDDELQSIDEMAPVITNQIYSIISAEL